MSERHFGFLYLVSGSPGQFSHSQIPCFFREQRAESEVVVVCTLESDAGLRSRPSQPAESGLVPERGEGEMLRSAESLTRQLRRNWRQI